MIPAAALLLAAAVLIRPRSRAAPTRVTARRRVPVPVVAAALIAVVVIGTPAPVAISVTVAAGTGWLRHRRRQARRHITEEGRILAGALELLTAELRAGAHPVRAFDATAAETPGPVGTGLAEVAARARLGADVAAGLRAVADRSGIPRHWERLAGCWQLGSDHGLPIGMLMHTAHLDLAERARFAAQVDAGMAGARATAAILTGLPVLGVVLGELLGAAPVAFLVRGAGGGWVLVVGVVLVCAGVLWSGRITDRVPA
jgi:tight adherence protein B